MRIAIIACRVFNREISKIVSESPHVCIVYWLDQGLHNTPSLLREQLKQQIDSIDELQNDLFIRKKFDAIVLGYGLCSNGIEGISSKTLPLIIPRCDDCIALFLGSQKRYLDYFHSNNGIYWYNPGWIEIGSVPGEEEYRHLLTSYTELYGEDNAEYLVEMEKAWVTKYESCFYVRSAVHTDTQAQQEAKTAADYFGWKFEIVSSDLSMLTRLLSGEWDESEFLTCPAGQSVCLSYDERKIVCSSVDEKRVQPL